ncbi:unnamed protein product [Euphydryas editha]|uniref:CCHC-type domain-containing protein n=1 Tax=Euphydryas editha TaxID=104508 RepID=A0AAU9UIJ1_EUPED|nr:unnamed protein product [Euphydryas editha]
MYSSEDKVSGGFIDISLAERMINKYDGDKSNLHVFIDNCNNAFALLNPVYKIAFVSVVLSKIEGNIRSTLLNRSFPSWENLKEHLLENYSEKRTFAQWQLELNSCRQGQNESISKYSSRVENCYIKLIKSLEPKLTKEAREANVELLKKQALNIFISGLLPQLHILLKSQKPSTFEDAVSIAISEEQEIKSRQEMSARQYYNTGIKKCTNCNKLNHLAHQCRNQPMIRQMYTNQTNNHIPTCFYCKKKGHISKECWNNPNNSNNSHSPQNNNFNRSNNNWNYSNRNNRQTNNRSNENRNLNSKGAEVTLIKITSLESQTLLYEDKKIKLKGIDKDARPTDTIGYVHLTFEIGDNRVYHTLHVVPDNFPIQCDGVIGSDFLSKTDSIISYKDNKIRICGIDMDIEHEEINFMSEELKENICRKGLQNNMCDEENKSDNMCFENVGSNIFESDCEVYPQILKNETINGNNMLEVSKNKISYESNMCKKNYKVHSQELKNENSYENNRNESVCEVHPQSFEQEKNHENNFLVIEPRCEKVISIFVKNPNLREGIISESIKISEGVYLCPSIVKVHESKALTMCLNTTDKEVKINKLFVKLEPIANNDQETREIIKLNKIRNDETYRGNRLDKLKQTLRIDNLNKEEKESLIELCQEYNHIFHLEGDKLTSTNTIMHEIPTNNNVPINTKSYRYPEALKEEVNEQIGKLLKDGIIQPSNNPWNSPVWVVPKKMDASGKKMATCD